MGQELRITFNGQDYHFQILNSKPINKSDQEIQLLLNGITTTLIKDDNGWRLKEQGDPENVDLAVAIGKAIGLRYRI
jgi:hypothetical protein